MSNSRKDRFEQGIADLARKTYDPYHELSPEQKSAVSRRPSGVDQNEAISQEMDTMQNLKRLIQTHLLNNNARQKGILDQSE